MTRDEVLRLEGRELVRAVGVHVMGWEPVETDDGTWWRLPGLPGPESYIATHVWRPDEDMDAAFDVIERMRERGYGVNIGADRSTMSDAWAVDFYGPFETGCHYKVVAAPFAVAACRAALLAVCGEGETDARDGVRQL